MSRKAVLTLFVSLMILALGAPLMAGRTGMKRLRVPGGAVSQSLWVWNLGDRPAAVRFGSGASIEVAAGSSQEAPGLRSGQPAVPADSAIVLVASSRDLDPETFEFDLRGTVQQEGSHVEVTRPAWARQLLVQAAGRSVLNAGQAVHATSETGEDGRARLALALVDPDSAVTVSVRDERGSEIRSFSVVSPVPVRLRADLGSAEEAANAGIEVKVVRGRAVTASAGWLKVANGHASFSPSNLIFSGSYTFSVSGGPANTCGELNIYRNGNPEFTGGWLCTDGSGNATKGPWNWSDKASDETGDPVFIRWPDNTATDSTYIIIDKNYAFTYIDSPMPTNSTPTSYYGHATDATWGTGFDFNYAAFSVFQDLSTGKYWDPATGQYNSTNQVWVTPSFQSKSNRWYISWGGSTFPSVSAHTTGHQYRWYTCFTDAQNGYCTGAGPGYWFPYEFTAN